MLYNKLIRTDMALLIAVVLLLILRNETARSVVMGFIFGIFIISLVNHISHYKKYKKLY